MSNAHLILGNPHSLINSLKRAHPQDIMAILSLTHKGKSRIVEA